MAGKSEAAPAVDLVSDAVVARLNVIINLLLDNIDPDKQLSHSAKISRLDELGLSTSEIASVVGKKSNYVSAALADRKKRKTSGRRRA